MTDGNSNRDKLEQIQRPVCVVKGTVETQKKSIGSKIKDVFFGNTGKDLVSSIYEDVVKPGILDLLYDAITGAAANICYKDSRPAKRHGGSSYEKTQYSVIASPKQKRPDVRKGPFDLEEVFDDYIDAQDVIDAMKDRVIRFGYTTVGDYYDLLGKSAPGNYKTADYGWDDLDDVKPIKRRGGWVLDLPRPKYLD